MATFDLVLRKQRVLQFFRRGRRPETLLPWPVLVYLLVYPLYTAVKFSYHGYQQSLLMHTLSQKFR